MDFFTSQISSSTLTPSLLAQGTMRSTWRVKVSLVIFRISFRIIPATSSRLTKTAMTRLVKNILNQMLNLQTISSSTLNRRQCSTISLLTMMIYLGSRVLYMKVLYMNFTMRHALQRIWKPWRKLYSSSSQSENWTMSPKSTRCFKKFLLVT